MEPLVLKSFDGANLCCFQSEPKTSPKGVVQIIHGMSEHSLRYTELANFLNQHGFVVFADDHRAHGDTAGSPDQVGKYAQPSNLFNDTVKDEIFVSHYLKKSYPDLPLFVFGHSYGSLILQRYLEISNVHDGAILCGTSYMNTLENKMARSIAKVTKVFKGNNAPAKLIETLSFKKYNKGLPEGELWISHDRNVVKKYLSDPYCTQTFSAKFYYDMMSGIMPAYKKSELAKIDKRKPLMLIAGAKDAFSKNAKLVTKLYKIYQNLGINDLSMHIYPNMRHEIHNEINNACVYADIKNFLNDKTQNIENAK